MLAAGLAESLNEHCGDNVRRLLANAVVVDAVHPPRATTPGSGVVAGRNLLRFYGVEEVNQVNNSSPTSQKD